MTKAIQPRPIDLIVDYFIWKSNGENKPITNKKLQKLLYYAQAWNVTIRNKPLFEDKIEAWVHGPAVRSIYFAFKQFGFSPIQKEIKISRIEKIEEKDKTILDEVWKVYGKYDARYLELLTHNEIPWQEARQGAGVCESCSNEINLETMKKYYSSLKKQK